MLRSRSPLAAAVLVGLVMMSPAGVVAASPRSDFAPSGAAPSGATPDIPVTSALVEPEHGMFVGIEPARLVDTRPGRSTIDHLSQGRGQFSGTYDFRVTGRGDVPSSGVGAVVLNVTATGPANEGYLTLFPAGASRPDTSNVNYVKGQTVASSVIARVGVDGQVSVYSHARSNVIVDVTGWFPDDSSFEAMVPERLADTRPNRSTTDGLFNGDGRFRGDYELLVAGRGGVPADGAGAVVLTVTAVKPAGEGYVTVYPTGAGRPNASSLNFLGGQVVPNMVIAKIGDDGRVSIHSSVTTDVIVDVAGWMPTDSDYDAISPKRLVETRPAGPGRSTVDGKDLGRGDYVHTRNVRVTGRAGVPGSGVEAVVINVTVVNAAGAGYTTVLPTGVPIPNASNVNHDPRQAVANTVIAKVGRDGRITIYNQSRAHLIVDIVGWIDAPEEPDQDLSGWTEMDFGFDRTDWAPGAITDDDIVVGTYSAGDVGMVTCDYPCDEPYMYIYVGTDTFGLVDVDPFGATIVSGEWMDQGSLYEVYRAATYLGQVPVALAADGDLWYVAPRKVTYRGQVVGTAFSVAQFADVPVHWDISDADPAGFAFAEVLALPAGYGSGDATAISGNGKIAGTVATAAGLERAVVWNDAGSQPVLLKMPAGSPADAIITITDISDSGRVVGTIDASGGGAPGGGDGSRGVVWESPTSDPVWLQVPTGALATYLVEVATSGAILGFTVDESFSIEYHVWNSTSSKPIPVEDMVFNWGSPPVGQPGINGSGKLAMGMHEPDVGLVAKLWPSASSTPISLPTSEHPFGVRPSDINGSGRMVGHAYGNSDFRLSVWDDAASDAVDLAVGGQPMNSDRQYISDGGAIVASGYLGTPGNFTGLTGVSYYWSDMHSPAVQLVSPGPDPDGWTTVAGVSDIGPVVAGTASTGEFPFWIMTNMPVVWEGPSLTPRFLPLPDGCDEGRIDAMSGGGAMIGTCGSGDESYGRVVYWASASDEPLELSTPMGDRDWYMIGVSDSGQVIGTADGWGSSEQYVWSTPGAVPVKMQAPASTDGVWIHSISSDGTIGGTARMPDGTAGIFEWDADSLTPVSVDVPATYYVVDRVLTGTGGTLAVVGRTTVGPVTWVYQPNDAI